jgi:23S rRNA pseudouridine2605 synthase
MLDRGARAQLKTLTKENADWVARHLVATAEYLETDPELAHRHALAASRRAGRIAVVRETVAITAYETGDFALALRELRTYRRISGNNDQLPLMVDSERGVGRSDKALELGRSVERETLPPAVQVGLAIAMSGARLDLGQAEMALSELEIPQLDPDRAFSYSPALFSAYAEVLEELGRHTDAADWRARAIRAEEALGGPAEAEVFEVYELEETVDTDAAVRSDLADRPGVDTDLDAVSADDVVDSAEVASVEEVMGAREVASVDDVVGDSAVASVEQLLGTADVASVEAVVGAAEQTAEGDPADAIEPEVAALLAETDPEAQPADAEPREEPADGAVPREK